MSVGHAKNPTFGRITFTHTYEVICQNRKDRLPVLGKIVRSDSGRPSISKFMKAGMTVPKSSKYVLLVIDLRL